MIGRASIGYPWIFNEIKHYFEHGVEAKKPTVEQRVAAAREHFELSLKWKEERYAIMETRKHYLLTTTIVLSIGTSISMWSTGKVIQQIKEA